MMQRPQHMTPNPLYYLLLLPDMAESYQPQRKKSHDKESYYMLPLGSESDIDKDIHPQPLDQEYEFIKHHLSIYERYARQSPLYNAIHYTAEYKKANQIIIIHVHFDQHKNYLLHTICNSSRQSIPLPETIVSKMLKFAEQCAREIFSRLFDDLRQKQDDINKARLECLKNLENESSNTSTRSPAYKILLSTTIKTLTTYEQLTFDPDCTQKRFLERYQQFLNQLEQTSLPKKTAAKSIQQTEVTPPETKENDEKKSEKPELLKTTRKKPLETSTAPTSSEGLRHAKLKKKKHDINQKLERCPPDDIDTAIAIFRELDSINEWEGDALLDACIQGDLAFVQQCFSERRWESFGFPIYNSLLPTCVYHNRLELFNYLAETIKNRFVTHDQLNYHNYIYRSVYPKKETDVCTNNTSLFWIAYNRKHPALFKQLTMTYPNEITPDMLGVIIGDGDNDYLSCILESGYNPDELWLNLIAIPKNSTSQFIEHQTTMCRTAQRRFLHHAVLSQNAGAVKLLIEHKADLSVRCGDGFTPFGAALFPTFRYDRDGNRTTDKFTINKEIVSLFVNAGCSIDEPQTRENQTGLYFACANNDLTSVATLLEFNANPFAPHTAKMALTPPNTPSIEQKKNKKSKAPSRALVRKEQNNKNSLQTTIHNVPSCPFYVALIKGHTEITERLLQGNIAINADDVILYMKRCLLMNKNTVELSLRSMVILRTICQQAGKLGDFEKLLPGQVILNGADQPEDESASTQAYSDTLLASQPLNSLGGKLDTFEELLPSQTILNGTDQPEDKSTSTQANNSDTLLVASQPLSSLGRSYGLFFQPAPSTELPLLNLSKKPEDIFTQAGNLPRLGALEISEQPSYIHGSLSSPRASRIKAS